LLAALIVLQGVTGYRLFTHPRTGPVAADDGPEVTLRVDGDSVLSTLAQALVAVDLMAEAAASAPDSGVATPTGLRAYPELLRAVQHVYAARLSDDPQRAQDRAEGLRASLEPYGIDLLDTWTQREPPPAELFIIQRSLDPSSRTYRVILPAVTDAQGVILPGRMAAPAEDTGKGEAPTSHASGTARCPDE